MRRALIGLLMAATVATPVAAQTAEQPRTARQQRAIEHYQRLEQRNQQRYGNAEQRAAVREQRSQQAVQAPQRQRSVEMQQRRAERQEQRAQGDGNRITTGWTGQRNDPRLREDQRRYDRTARENALRYGTAEQRREVRQDRRDDRRGWRNDRRDDRRDWRNNDRRDWSRTWNRGWRNDNRYDWQRYRYSNRDIFRPGRYYAPYRGYNYSRFSIGLTLGSAFYSDRYWINDPWQYRLPPAYAGTRWVRYYDDVLLVDMYTGEVVDVIYDFFW